MAIEETVGLNHRDRRQSSTFNVAVQILDVLEVRAERRIRHDLRRVEKRIADDAICGAPVWSVLGASFPAFAIGAPGNTLPAEFQSDSVLLGRRSGEISRCALVSHLSRA